MKRSLDEEITRWRDHLMKISCDENFASKNLTPEKSQITLKVTSNLAVHFVCTLRPSLIVRYFGNALPPQLTAMQYCSTLRPCPPVMLYSHALQRTGVIAYGPPRSVSKGHRFPSQYQLCSLSQTKNGWTNIYAEQNACDRKHHKRYAHNCTVLEGFRSRQDLSLWRPWWRWEEKIDLEHDLIRNYIRRRHPGIPMELIPIQKFDIIPTALNSETN